MPEPDISKKISDLRRSGKLKEAYNLLIDYKKSLHTDQRLELIYCLNEESQIFYRQGLLDKGVACAKEALKFAEQDPSDTRGQADALNNLGSNYWEQGNLKAAETNYHLSLKLREKLGDLEKLAASYNNLGVIYSQKGDLLQSEKFYQKSLDLEKKINSPRGIAQSHANLGDLYVMRGQLYLAEQHHMESLTYFEKINEPPGIGIALCNLGELYTSKGDYKQAEKYIRRSLAIYEEIGNVIDLAYVRYELIKTLLAQDLVDLATREVKKLEKLVDSRYPAISTRSKLALGRLKFHSHELRSAYDLVNQAKESAKDSGDFELLIDAAYLIVQIKLQLFLLTKEETHKSEVTTLLNELEQLSRREHLLGTYVRTLLTQGYLKRALFDIPKAIHYFELAEYLALERGLNPISKLAKKELQNLREQTTMLQKLITSSPKDYEDVQFGEMLSYLQDVQKHFKHSGL